MSNANAVDQIRKVIGDRIPVITRIPDQNGYDESSHESQPPEAVCFVESARAGLASRRLHQYLRYAGLIFQSNPRCRRFTWWYGGGPRCEHQHGSISQLHESGQENTHLDWPCLMWPNGNDGRSPRVPEK